MKLKKIASLMLAGIMAVSMLAGCSNGNSNSGNNNGGETVSATGIAKVFNDNQSVTNNVKVVFSNSSVLDSALVTAVERAGQNSQIVSAQLKDYVGAQVSYITGIIDEGNFVTTDADSKDGLEITKLYVEVLNSVSNNVWTEDAAIQKAADNLDTIISSLKDTTYQKNTTQAGATYYDYTYTGTASMASAKNEKGETNYFFVYTITQTSDAKVLN